MLYITFIYISSILVPKFFYFHGIVITACTFIFPFTYILGDIIAEVYGYKISRSVIIYSFICLFLFDNLIPLISSIPQSMAKIHANSFERVLGHLPRLFLADLVAINLGAFLNVFVLTKWRVILKGRYFALRSLGSSAIGEFFFTIIAFTIFFIGRRPFHIWMYAMVSSYVFKMMFSMVAVFPASLCVRLIKKHEKSGERPRLSIEINPFKHAA